MRMAITATATGLTGQISTNSEADAAQVRRQFEPVLPFARYTLDGHAHDRSHLGPGSATALPLPLFKLPLRLGSHLWCADETRLLPHLGLGGAALLAWTLVRHIDPAVIVRSG
jgi:hypothetical protein